MVPLGVAGRRVEVIPATRRREPVNAWRKRDKRCAHDGSKESHQDLCCGLHWTCQPSSRSACCCCCGRGRSGGGSPPTGVDIGDGDAEARNGEDESLRIRSTE